jgi:hypothetical protein
MRQSVSAEMARTGLTWDAILQHFYGGIELALLDLPPAGHALRFRGLPEDGQEANRLQIPAGDVTEGAAAAPVNVGDGDFTIEWWLKALPSDNQASPVNCGPAADWIYGNILLDHFRPGRQPGYGVSLAGGAPVFGVTGRNGRSLTICAGAPVADGRWHHLAVQRRLADGAMWLYVDGRLAAQGAGPTGEIGYPASFQTAFPDREPFISLGGWRMEPDHKLHPFFRGWLDELRFSQGLRYSEAFEPPQEPFQVDEATLALYHFDEGIGQAALGERRAGEATAAGLLLVGGLDSGPEWVPSDLFSQSLPLFLPALTGRSDPERP